MTKYILNSGGLSSNPQEAKKFYKEVVKGLGSNPKILFCFFARSREDWEIKFIEYQAGFTQFLPAEVQPSFELAFPDKFEEQIQQSNAIYIHGGDDHLLQYWLKQFDLPNLWLGKVVATSSAGSDAMVESFWTCDWRQCMDGLGFLKIKFIPHFQSTSYAEDDPRGAIDWARAYGEIKAYGNKALPIHALKEGEFVVIET